MIFSYHSFDCDFVIKCPVLKIDIVNCSHYREEEHYLESKKEKNLAHILIKAYSCVLMALSREEREGESTEQIPGLSRWQNRLLYSTMRRALYTLLLEP